METGPLIPRPELRDSIKLANGQEISLDRDNATIVEHGNGYEYMDHLFIRMLGDYGLRMFGLRASPFYDYLVERGYDRLIKEYPDDVTVAIWEQYEAHEMERELEKGDGHELDG